MSRPAAKHSDDYFSAFSLSEHFDIDEKALEAAYFKLQREYHPDRAVHLPPEKRLEMVKTSMRINEAYQTLKNPLRRAQYILRQRGVKVGGEDDTVKPSQSLLQQVMEWREMASENIDKARLGHITQLLLTQESDLLRALSDAFDKHQIEQAAHHTLELGYVEKILYELRQKTVRIA